MALCLSSVETFCFATSIVCEVINSFGCCQAGWYAEMFVFKTDKAGTFQEVDIFTFTDHVHALAMFTNRPCSCVDHDYTQTLSMYQPCSHIQFIHHVQYVHTVIMFIY